MKKSKKLLSIVLSIALVAGISVGATLALLSKQSEEVTNTFVATSGLVENFKAYEKAKDEQDAKGNWTVDNTDTGWTEVDGTKFKGQEYGNILPGITIEKRVAFYADKFTADAYVFAKVADTATDVSDPVYTGWTKVEGANKLGTNEVLYVYGTGAAKSFAKDAEPGYVDLFNATGDAALTVADFTDAKGDLGAITVTFYTCQTATFDSPAAAWNAIWGK